MRLNLVLKLLNQNLFLIEIMICLINKTKIFLNFVKIQLIL